MNTKKNAGSITRQLQVVFAISILLLLISSIASFYSNRKLIDTSQWVNHTNEVLREADNIIAIVKDAENGQRGYIITNDPLFLQNYTGAYPRVVTSYEKLKELTIDNPVQQKNLEDARKKFEERFDQMQKVIELNSKKNIVDRDSFLDANKQEIIRGKQIMDDLRFIIQKIKTEESRLLDIRVKEQDNYIRFTPPTILIAACISILISLLAYFRIKSDLDQRAAKQREEAEIYAATNRRISVMEDIAHKIASGDYSVRSTDNQKDDLGRISAALNEMVVSLEANFNELNDRNWLQTGNALVNETLRGERFLAKLATKAIVKIAEYLEAPLGTLYVADRKLNLKLAGKFAASDAPEEISEGTGLLGEAVRSGESMLVNNIPENYTRITSSVGNTLPAHLLIQPLHYNNEIIGVIELGLLRKPDDLAVEFLKLNAEAIAIAINGAISYERMQDLLEETQAQSEELQSQHNELENINAELEMQTERLQASEEELKVQQEELQQANMELEERSRMLEERNHQIIEKNIEVQKQAEELALSTKYKSEFLANMSHELRTPLNSILLLSRLLYENNEQNLSTDQVEYAKVIQSSGNGLLSLIDEILDLSKIEAGKMQLEYEPTTIASIGEDMKMLFDPIAKEKQIAFKIETDETTPDFFETDKQRLEQILKNLISNAMKFTSKGSITLSVKRNQGDHNLLSFAVADTGIGIAADKQKLIFEAFQQADGSTRRKYGGTGLGLSISRELVRLLGGTIDLESEPGKGSIFTVSVPLDKTYRIENTSRLSDFLDSLAETEEVNNSAAQEENVYVLKDIPESIPDDRAQIKADDRSILIVEDDVNFAKSLLEFTHRKGYKGIVCVRGDEAVDCAKRYSPVGILLDIQLPVKSGWEVMEELKNNPKTRHIPVHIMSSYEVRKESISKGAVDFVSKPVAFDQIQQIFEKLEYVLNRQSNKVLIIEDNPKHAKALAYFLETFNINSEIKNTIADSVDALKKEADCVILDMGIPDQKTYDMLEEVKQTEGLENLPIIIFTGKSLSMAEEQRIKQYADSIVIKTAHSYQRILDEISLFLHLVEENKARPTNGTPKKLGALNEVLKGKTVLVVDDDVRNIFSLTKALERMEMNIIPAIDGKDAMQKLNENSNINIVLLDMMMPEMDGYETAKRIRENYQWKDLPVIAVTAKAMVGDREKCIQAGASDYITKPVDIDQLLSLLRVWLYERV